MRVPRAAWFALAAGLLAVAAWPRRRRLAVQRVVRISRVVADLDRAEAFYRDALGFETVARGQSDPAALFELGLDKAEAEEAVMRLGAATIALVCFADKGRSYPPDSRSNDLWFQHLAIVVSDMDAGYEHLTQAGGWHAISEGGPQLLPPANGSVRAFKFRDPDGHPLELIWFPPAGKEPSDALFVNVDHSALAIASTWRSVAFYRGLGFTVKARSLNHGPAQDHLDAIANARVRVTSLRPALDGPGLELLGYQPPGRRAGETSPNDMVVDWVTISLPHLSGARRRMMRDPDGHRLMLIDQTSELAA